MQKLRLALIALVVAIVILGLGYAWGASGRRALQRSLDEAQQQTETAQARGLLLDARVSLYNMNFGDASRNFEDAKVPLRRAQQRFADSGEADRARSIGTALERVDEAQRLAGKLDQAANSKAGEALDALRAATSR
jgi:hypothetical protein